MTHAVNLLPWRDLRRRQRLRYVLLIDHRHYAAGRDEPAGDAARSRLQRDFLATLHATADAQLARLA